MPDSYFYDDEVNFDLLKDSVSSKLGKRKASKLTSERSRGDKNREKRCKRRKKEAGYNTRRNPGNDEKHDEHYTDTHEGSGGPEKGKDRAPGRTEE